MTSEVKNRNGKPKSSKPTFSQGQFINHSFTDDDKSKFKTWAETFAVQLGDLVDRLCDDGYGISVKYDAYTDAYASFIQTRDEKSSNYGLILTGRSRSAQMAMLAVLYRHYVVFEADWPNDVARKTGMDDE
ncbi:MAG TPA: hypothetical protein V6C97_27525 [Oculatellaceae cyanobacterium]